MSHATDSRFQRYTASAATDDNPYAPDSEVYVRIGEGEQGDTVNTLGGVVPVNKGDAVVEVPDRPGTYDVIPADSWSSLDWTGDSDSSDSGTTTTNNDENDSDSNADEGYDSWSNTELGDEIDARNAQRDADSQLDKPRSNADRARVLTDDDATA